MTSYWIRKENITPELMKTLVDLGYIQNQEYFNSDIADILFTTFNQKTFTFANFEHAYSNANPHRTWLCGLREYIETSDEFIKKLIEHE